MCMLKHHALATGLSESNLAIDCSVGEIGDAHFKHP